MGPTGTPAGRGAGKVAPKGRCGDRPCPPLCGEPPRASPERRVLLPRAREDLARALSRGRAPRRGCFFFFLDHVPFHLMDPPSWRARVCSVPVTSGLPSTSSLPTSVPCSPPAFGIAGPPRPRSARGAHGGRRGRKSRARPRGEPVWVLPCRAAGAAVSLGGRRRACQAPST